MGIIRSAGTIRAPQIAGRFYPNDPSSCRALVQTSLQQGLPAYGIKTKVLVAPHAGHVYSGQIAGTAYQPLQERSMQISRVVLLAPAHRISFRGLAITNVEAWASPLGTIPIDWPALQSVLNLPDVAINDDAFEGEHSLEVQLPFIQTVFPNASLVPLLVGDADQWLVSRALELLWGGPETLIVISTDLSHFLASDQARKMDHQTSIWIELLRPDKLDGNNACGVRALAGALDQASRRDMRVTALDVRHSGDITGQQERVVGYGAFAMEQAHGVRLPEELRQQLINAAREAIKWRLKHGKIATINFKEPLPAPLRSFRASFITLKLKGVLRGCVGTVAAKRPLIIDVIENACKAAFEDPRFQPLSIDELDCLSVSVSILSTPRQIKLKDEPDLLRQIKPDLDGLILQDQDRGGLFLPSVWASLPEAEVFLRQLKGKAGLPPDHWSSSLQIHRFSTEIFESAFS